MKKALHLALVASTVSLPAHADGSRDVHKWLQREIAGLADGSGWTSDIDQHMLSIFDMSSQGSDEIVVGAADRRVKLDQAIIRAGVMHSFLIKDVDGDGQLTKSDLDIFYAEKLARQMTVFPTVTPTKARLDAMLEACEKADFAFDSNQDGTITFQEMLAASKSSKFGRTYPVDVGIFVMPQEVMLDTNEDGKITRAEFLTLVRQAVSELDSDGDGKLSEAEIKAALSEPVQPFR